MSPNAPTVSKTVRFPGRASSARITARSTPSRIRYPSAACGAEAVAERVLVDRRVGDLVGGVERSVARERDLDEDRKSQD